MNNTINQCSKRVIIHEGVDLSFGLSAALDFDREYVKTGRLNKGAYHYRTYKSENGSQMADVWHTSTSIIVRTAEIPEVAEVPEGLDQPEKKES